MKFSLCYPADSWFKTEYFIWSRRNRSQSHRDLKKECFHSKWKAWNLSSICFMLGPIYSVLLKSRLLSLSFWTGLQSQPCFAVPILLHLCFSDDSHVCKSELTAQKMIWFLIDTDSKSQKGAVVLPFRLSEAYRVVLYEHLHKSNKNKSM